MAGKKEREGKKGRLVRCRYDNSLAKLLVILEREREREREASQKPVRREGERKKSEFSFGRWLAWFEVTTII